MKAIPKTKVIVHYLKSELVDRKKYHFTFSKDGLLMNNIPLFAGSPIDGDAEALHIGVWKTENDIESQWVSDLVYKIIDGPCVILEAEDDFVEVKSSKKKNK
jgi:hypothetical protein